MPNITESYNGKEHLHVCGFNFVTKRSALPHLTWHRQRRGGTERSYLGVLSLVQIETSPLWNMARNSEDLPAAPFTLSQILKMNTQIAQHIANSLRPIKPAAASSRTALQLVCLLRATLVSRKLHQALRQVM